jgi:release factor glutamine methyltransferase
LARCRGLASGRSATSGNSSSRANARSALASDDEGYADLLAIATAARQRLRPGGLLLLEHGATQAPRLAGALVARGYARVVCHPDLAGLARVTEAHFP